MNFCVQAKQTGIKRSISGQSVSFHIVSLTKIGMHLFVLYIVCFLVCKAQFFGGAHTILSSRKDQLGNYPNCCLVLFASRRTGRFFHCVYFVGTTVSSKV